MDSRTEMQLRVICEVGAHFDRIGARFWLRGGWAVDFMLGRVTRSHDDIDLVIWARHYRRAAEALIDAGYRVAPDRTGSACERSYHLTEMLSKQTVMARGL